MKRQSAPRMLEQASSAREQRPRHDERAASHVAKHRDPYGVTGNVRRGKRWPPVSLGSRSVARSKEASGQGLISNSKAELSRPQTNATSWAPCEKSTNDCDRDGRSNAHGRVRLDCVAPTRAASRLGPSCCRRCARSTSEGLPRSELPPAPDVCLARTTESRSSGVRSGLNPSANTARCLHFRLFGGRPSSIMPDERHGSPRPTVMTPRRRRGRHTTRHANKERVPWEPTRINRVTS